MCSSAAGYRLARDVLGMKGNLTFESLEKAASYVTEYSSVIDSDVSVMLSGMCPAAGGKTVYELDTAMFMKKPACTKEKMAEWLIEIGKSLKFANDLLKIANSTISRLQSASIKDKENIIKLQEEVISIKNDQLQSVTTTVQSEMKSYCDIVKKSCKKTAVTQEKLTKAVKTVVEEEDRGKNLMVFGLKEDKEEDLTAKVDKIFNSVGEKLCVLECVRIGAIPETSSSTTRPVKVIMRSSESVYQVLRKSGKLRGSESYKTVFFSPDRTQEERTAHQQLVLQMKEKIKSDPVNYHFIKNGTVMSRPRN